MGFKRVPSLRSFVVGLGLVVGIAFVVTFGLVVGFCVVAGAKTKQNILAIHLR